jgi:cyanate lyase
MAIKIKKKEYPIRVTMWALLTFKREKGKQVSDLKDEDLEEMLYYTYLCVRGACMQDSVPFDMSFEDFVAQVEGDPMEALVMEKLDDVKKKMESH